MGLQTDMQLVVQQMIKGEWALERRYLLGFFPASDDGRKRQLHEDALCKVFFGQTGSNHVFLKNDAVTEYNRSQVIFRATLFIAWVDMNCFYIKCLLSIFRVGAELACGGA